MDKIHEVQRYRGFVLELMTELVGFLEHILKWRQKKWKHQVYQHVFFSFDYYNSFLKSCETKDNVSQFYAAFKNEKKEEIMNVIKPNTTIYHTCVIMLHNVYPPYRHIISCRKKRKINCMNLL